MSDGRPFLYRGGVLCCGSVPLGDLAQRFDTPLYVYSGDGIAERARMFQHSFAGTPHTGCYAVKANS